MFIQKKDEWMPVCDDDLKHTVSHLPFKTIKATSSELIKVVQFFEQIVKKYRIMTQIVNFGIQQNKDKRYKHQLDKLDKINAKINNIITEFRTKILALESKCNFEKYEFIIPFKEKIYKAYHEFRKLGLVFVAKHYFSKCKAQYKQYQNLDKSEPKSQSLAMTRLASKRENSFK